MPIANVSIYKVSFSQHFYELNCVGRSTQGKPTEEGRDILGMIIW